MTLKCLIVVTFIFLLLLIGGGVNASTEVYFAFGSKSYFVYDLKPFDVEFDYNLVNYPLDEFVVCPHVQNGTIEIYDSTAQQWIKSNDVYTELPHLKKEMQIRVKYGSVSKLDLWFEVHDLKTAKTYVTPKRTYWTPNALSYYLPKVYERIVETTQSTEAILSVSDVVSKTVAKDIATRKRQRLIVFSMTGFVFSAYLGFCRRKVHQAKTAGKIN